MSISLARCRTTRATSSGFARSLPVPDASLGALGYLFDVVANLIGGRGRWRTLPWLVLLLGVVVAGMGVAGVLLAVSQPVLFRAACTLCLASAACSVLLVWLVKDEVRASLQTIFPSIQGVRLATRIDEQTLDKAMTHLREAHQLDPARAHALVVAAAIGVFAAAFAVELGIRPADFIRHSDVPLYQEYGSAISDGRAHSRIEPPWVGSNSTSTRVNPPEARAREV